MVEHTHMATTLNDVTFNLSPPRLAKSGPRMKHPTRLEREKAAIGDPNAFDHPGDPKLIGPWVIGETVGKGASGRVKVARHMTTGKLAAVKILPAGIVARSRNSLVKAEKYRMDIEREIVMMKLMEHPNIMSLYDVWEGERELFLVLEWIAGGELFDLIVDRGRLPALEALAYFKQIIHGLSYCHAFSIAHRDLKPENILIHGANNEFLKIADWGMAAFQSPLAQLETFCGSPHYASPEIIRGEPYEGNKADIWSVGVVLFALIAGKLPFDDKHIPTLLAKVKSGKFEIPPYVFPEAADLIKRMLIVDVAKRITMKEIFKHPFFSRDTPGIYYVPPPSVSALHAPLSSAGDIDQDVLSSLRIIFGKHTTRAFIVHELLREGPNAAKIFYVLLLKFRERQMEHFNDDCEEVDGLHPYHSPRMQPIEHLSIAEPITPLSAVTFRPTHVRTRSSPTKNRSTLSGAYPHLATISGARAPGLPLPLAPVPSYATATGKDRTMYRPQSSAPPVVRTSSMARPSGKRRDTSPNAELGPGTTSPATRLAFGMPVPPNKWKNETPTSGQRPESDAGKEGELASPIRQTEVGDQKEPPRSPAPRMRRATSPSQPPLPQEPSPPSEGLDTSHAPTPAYGFANSPPWKSETQSETVVLTNQINVLGDRDNIEHPQLQSPLMLQESQKSGKEGSAVRRSSSSRRKTNNTPEKYSNLPSIEEKENIGAPFRSRADGETVKRTKSAKSPFAHPYGDQTRETTEPLTSTEEKEKDGGGNMSRTRAGSEGAKSVQGEKRGIIRRNRPTALNLDEAFRRPALNIASPPSTPATPLLNPVVGEFRGWFSNLFNWRTPTYVLHSYNNVFTTRDETTRLLMKFGASIMLDDAQGRSGLKCRLDEVMDVNGVVTQKRVRFRVDFAPYRAHPLMSPALDGSSPASLLVSPLTEIPFSCTVTLIQEKGALSTFRAVYHRLRMEWRLDGLNSPAVGNISPMYDAHPVSEVERRIGVIRLR